MGVQTEITGEGEKLFSGAIKIPKKVESGYVMPEVATTIHHCGNLDYFFAFQRAESWM